MKLYQINETDLQKLEHALPRLMIAAPMVLNRPEVQAMWEEVKEIVGNVRWDYGPPSEVHQVDAGEPS